MMALVHDLAEAQGIFFLPRYTLFIPDIPMTFLTGSWGYRSA